MKIRDLNETTLEHIQKQNKASRVKSAKTGSVSGTGGTSKVDQVSISGKSRDMQKLRAVIADTPDVREDKVAELREKIASGRYQVSAREIAKSILDEI